MNAFVIQTNSDTPGQAIEVHLVEADAAKKVKLLNKMGTDTFWYRRVPLLHRLLIGIEMGKPTMAIAQALDAEP